MPSAYPAQNKDATAGSGISLDAHNTSIQCIPQSVDPHHHHHQITRHLFSLVPLHLIMLSPTLILVMMIFNLKQLKAPRNLLVPVAAYIGTIIPYYMVSFCVLDVSCV